jgi:hypothetical protein
MGREVRCDAVKALGWNEDLNRSMDFEFIWLLICIGFKKIQKGFEFKL